ncbi:hypothetical protein FDJ19_gp071 [Vibrio phage Ceto]|uniref:LITAF domain-containing protein n=1 Tax=Vibrio phage Ceto TaxID=2570300 RepID=A0A2H5BGI2_9CAUD|nr:hypothetical protein FDJ19_gp071 [Vibrio phage Ceto]AUG85078.1 hypothetical protein CETO_71 [Vibrio phage Ceto]
MRIEKRYCPSCNTSTPHEVDETSHVVHLILSLLTGGLWLLVWLACTLSQKDPKCTECNTNHP